MENGPRRHFRGWNGALGLLSLVLFACEPRVDGGVSVGQDQGQYVRPQVPVTTSREVAEPVAEPLVACAERRKELLALPEIGSRLNEPELRATLLARAKGEPVLFLRDPTFTGTATQGIAERRAYLEKTKFPLDATRAILKNFAGLPNELRQLLLRDGYFVAFHPEALRELSVRITLEDLFVEPSLTILRGSEQLSVVRDKKGRYRYASGEARGEPATLLFWDRVWKSGEEPGRVQHVDLRRLKSEEGFDEMRLIHLTEQGALASALYDGEWVEMVLRFSPPSAALECLIASEDQNKHVLAARKRARSIALLRSAMIEQIRQGLPFDEPKTEVGQEDGKLRALWTRAYLAGRKTYQHRDDKYRVFDELGHPIAPQVCIDFVTESLERASGMLIASEGAPPSITKGTIDFDALLGEDRRREMALREFARGEKTGFTLHDVEEKERIPYERVSSFFSDLRAHRGEYRVGDVVIIRGRAKWDFYAEVHTHTFFIFETDPISGMPILLAGNSGKPRLVTWDMEMLRAPKRSIHHRVHIDTEWLSSHLSSRHEMRDAQFHPPLIVSEERRL